MLRLLAPAPPPSGGSRGGAKVGAAGPKLVTRIARHSRSPLHGYQTGHEGWRSGRIGTCDRNVLHLLQSVRAILRRLSRDLVTNTILGIYPKRGRSLEAPTQGHQEILRYVVGTETKLFSL